MIITELKKTEMRKTKDVFGNIVGTVSTDLLIMLGVGI